MAEPQVVFGSGTVHVTPTRDAKGNKISVPQVINVPEVTDINVGFGKSDVKTAQGKGQYAIHAARGKSQIEVSFTASEMYLREINALYFGQTVESGSHRIHRDNAGRVIPEGSSTKIKISTKKTFHLGKWLTNTSATINSSPATLETGAKIATGHYKFSDGLYRFAEADLGKTAQLTYTVSGGVTVVSTFKIPASLSINLVLLTKVNAVNKTGVANYFTRDSYNPAADTPGTQHYQTSPNGIIVFNSAEVVSVTFLHNTDSVSVSSLVTELPAAKVITIIDPPSSTLFAGDIGVELLTSSGTAMIGVAVGEALTKAETPTSGQYDQKGGIYVFAAADVGDDVRVSYSTDFMFLTVYPPADGEFIADKGVRNTEGMPLTRVELTSPISLLKDQYAVSGAGDYYFDIANRGDRVYIDYEYTSVEGGTLVIENLEMGCTPFVALDISSIDEGQEWLVQYPKATPKSYEFASKVDDYAHYKITFEVIADRVSKTVGTIYMVA